MRSGGGGGGSGFVSLSTVVDLHRATFENMHRPVAALRSTNVHVDYM